MARQVIQSMLPYCFLHTELFSSRRLPTKIFVTIIGTIINRRYFYLTVVIKSK